MVTGFHEESINSSRWSVSLMMIVTSEVKSYAEKMIGIKLCIGALLLISSYDAKSLPDIQDINYLAGIEDDIRYSNEPGLREEDLYVNENKASYTFGRGEGDGIQNAATTLENRKWPLPVPYEIDSSIGSTTRKAIEDAIKDFEEKTCITFTAKSNEVSDYVTFKGDLAGCWSYLGRLGGNQPISLGAGCGTRQIAVHEIMHALGFVHEHSRPDRDDHVEIKWENIQEDKEPQFRRAIDGLHDVLGVSYDYESVMHYGRKAFSKNTLDTIVPKDFEYDDNFEFGQPSNGGLSTKDAQQVNLLYGCNTGDGTWGEWSDWDDCDKSCGGGVRYRYRSCNNGVCTGVSKESESCNEDSCEQIWLCFPSDAYVRNIRGEKIEMKDLKVGEKVLTMDPVGQQVYTAITMMMHTDADRSGNDFISMSTVDGEQITMTTHHLIPVSSKGFLFAKDVKEGHNITIFDASQNAFQSKEVTSIEKVTKKGYFAPLSMEGTLLVNDVYVSCYAIFPSHSISHLVFSLWRALYANFENLLTQNKDESGIHWYPSMLMNTATYLNII